MAELGGLFPACAVCGATEALEFDVITPVDNDRHHKIEWSARMSFYTAQLRANNLRILCHFHNAQKGTLTDREFHQMRKEMEQPF